MLYLDSSALVKRYVLESGSAQLRQRLNRGDLVFTSQLTYAEILSVLGRKYQDRMMDRKAFLKLRGAFLADWSFALNRLEVSATTMSAIQHLLESFRLRGADAVHLGAALWLRDSVLAGQAPAGGDAAVEFGVADLRLAKVAAQCGLAVFNPEEEN